MLRRGPRYRPRDSRSGLQGKSVQSSPPAATYGQELGTIIERNYNYWLARKV